MKTARKYVWLLFFVCYTIFAYASTSVSIDRTVIPVKVTAKNENWVTTISICNTTQSAIPLTDIELDFNFSSPMPTNIWGQPWAAWHVGSQQGSAVVLLGGTPWTSALPPDPNCASPMTVQFDAAPNLPLPSAPFVFKAAVAMSTTNVTVTLSNSPELQQQITLTGQKFSFTKTVTNNSTIALPNDTYNVSAMTPGYSVVITPNPLIVPTNTTLNISYQASLGSRFVGVMESWKEVSTTDDAEQTNLGNIPAYLNVVNIAYIKPDSTYTKNSFNYAGTGLQLQYPSNTVLKFAVARLHRLHPNTKVLVSVGGPTYTNWASLNAKAIADFVIDYGLDGVDINFMPANPNCTLGADNLIHCQIDAAFKSYVDSLRAQLPRPFMITITSPGVGAYGQDQWKTATPQNQYTGILLPLLRTASAASIDLINVTAFDLGLTYDASQALAAFANYFPGPIAMGVSVPPEVGGHVYDLCQVIALTEAVKANANTRHTTPAMLLGSIAKKPSGAITPSNPDAQMIATTICTNLGLSDCNQPILLPVNSPFETRASHAPQGERSCARSSG